MSDKSSKVWTVGELLSTTCAFLAEKGSQSPRLDAEILLSGVLKVPRVKLYINFEKEMSPEDLDAYRELVRRRAKLEPVAYITGEKEFYGLRLKVGPEVLIPRPATEHLVDAVLREAKNLPGGPLEIADIGAGSGAISLALAKNLEKARLKAVDVSERALAVARENAEKAGLAERVEFFQGHLLKPLEGLRFNFICANLPYIPSSEMAGLMPDVGLFEPHLALDGGPEGLSLIGELLETAEPHLQADSLIFLEIWPASLSRLEELAAVQGFACREVVRDLEGFSRIVVLGR